MVSRTSPRKNDVEILIAEDSPTQAELLTNLLQEQGYTVTATVNGRQALEAARKRKPTLIVSDIVMPEMDGYELCKAVKADSKLQDIPVVIVTFLSGIHDIVMALDCGADNFIRKPYAPAALVSRIEYILSNRELRSSGRSEMKLGLEIYLGGKKHFITSEREQILDLLVSSYEQAVQVNEELKQRDLVISAMNANLLHHAAELEAANKELEAFSHSVSHDLREPLAAINGFTALLQKNYGDRLDNRGLDYLKHVRNATRRMSQLIDDMLYLSQVTRSELRFEETDLSTIAAEIATNLRSSQPDRLVELKVGPAAAQCDPRLIRVALENLLGNAWKFTGERKHARIECGLTEIDGELAYFVRDNGAGFDMTYAGKLFTPFQRLHSESEFPGLGIGLATVERVVQRHGGRIWAEAEADKGATFYFTLSAQGGPDTSFDGGRWASSSFKQLQ
ncbi:MAG: response regulator [Burkholderiales bacterium]